MKYSMDYANKKHQSCQNCGSSDGAYQYEDCLYCRVCKTKTFTDEQEETTEMQTLTAVKLFPPMTGTLSALSSTDLGKSLAEKNTAQTPRPEVKST